MNFKVYDLEPSFTLLKAAYLWCEKPIPLKSSALSIPNDVYVILSAFESEMQNFAIEIGNYISWGRKEWDIKQVTNTNRFFKKRCKTYGDMFDTVRVHFFSRIRVPYKEAKKFGHNTAKCFFKPCIGCLHENKCIYPIGHKPNFDIPSDEKSDVISLNLDGQIAVYEAVGENIFELTVTRDGLVRFAERVNQKPLFLFPELREPTVIQTLERTQKELKNQKAIIKKQKAELEKLREEKLPPYMDKNHFHYSSKLEAAVSAWETIFKNRKGELPAKEATIMKWLKKNRKDVPLKERIFNIVNPSK